MAYSKIITLDDHFSTGEPTVQLVSTWGRGGNLLREATSLHKIASTRSPAVEYIKTVAPEPGKTIVLVIGLGDNETYGANRNGDGFPSQPVKGKISADEVLTKHYQSYDKAHVFEHHVNNDPAKAIGRVKKAFWNPYMRRVELLEDFDNAKAPHLLEKIASGEYPSKSLGTRIKHDVCNNCGNRAKTRAEYCDHLKYAMSRIDPHSGVINSALNPSCDFFDSSWVIRPADRTGYMMKKVAKEHPYEIRMGSFELGDLINDLSNKSAELGKAADIEKIIQGAPAATVSNLAPKDAQLVKKYMTECAGKDDETPSHSRAVSIMISYKPSEALGSADEAGLPLGIKDLIQYFLGKIAPETRGADKAILKSANDHLGLIYSIYNKYPRFYSDIIKEASLDAPPVINAALVQKLAEESPTSDYLKRQILPKSLYEQRPNTDMVSWTDPNTGQQYHTNYRKVRTTNDALINQGLHQKALTSGALLGTGALLGGAAYATRNTRIPAPMRVATGVVGAGLGALGVKKLIDPTPIAGPKVVTDQGETISGWTPMTLNERSKVGSITVANFPYIVKRAHEAPRPMAPQYVTAFIDQLKSAEIHDELSPYIGPTLDLDKVAEVLGTSILRRTG